MKYHKPFLSIRDQLIQLQLRGLLIPDPDKAAKALQHLNYSRLRTYWYSFEADHEYPVDTGMMGVPAAWRSLPIWAVEG